MAKNLAYGIDFGTTNSTIALVNEIGKIEQMAIDRQSPNPAIMRSVVYVSPKMQYLFGAPAVEAYLVDVAQNQETKTKPIFTGRYIKVSGDSTSGGISNDQFVPEIIQVSESDNGRLFQSLKSSLSSNLLKSVNVFGEAMTLEMFVGNFLGEMKKRADEIVKQNVTKAIIGRPVKYVGGNEQLAMERMEEAAKIAGFDEVVFEYEPVGAAYDYGVSVNETQICLIFDFGGGTLDISIVKFPERKILVNVGLPIGGDYFNYKVFESQLAVYFGKGSRYGMYKHEFPNSLFRELKNWYRISLMKNEAFGKSLEHYDFMNTRPATVKALRSLVFNNLGFGLYEEIERVKKNLTDKEEDKFLFKAELIDIDSQISRVDLEEIISSDLSNIDNLINQAILEAGIEIDDIDVVATTGGSSLIPIVKNHLNQKFGKGKIKNSDTFTSVAKGLALRAKEVFG